MKKSNSSQAQAIFSLFSIEKGNQVKTFYIIVDKSISLCYNTYIKKEVKEKEMKDKMCEMLKRIIENDELDRKIKYSQNNRYREFYENGYGISVIPDISNPGLYEVAVIKGNELKWDILEGFENPVMNDVESGLTLEEVHEIGKKVSELERNQKIN